MKPPFSPTIALASLLAAGAMTAIQAACSAPRDMSPVVDGMDFTFLQADAALVPDPATPASCRSRRIRVAEAMPHGVLLVASGDDAEGRFQPQADFRWLVGLTTPGAFLLLVTSSDGPAKETLFLPLFDARHELWNGPRSAPGPDAQGLTGIARTRPTEDLDSALAALLRARGSDPGVILAAGDSAMEALQQAGLAPSAARTLLRPLQAVHEPGEMRALRSAIDITQAALLEAFRSVRPGRYEYTAEAAIEGTFRTRGASGPAFPSICGSGPNTCFLHYRANQRRLEAGAIMVMDVGARVHGYCADITRTIPIGGRFTARQREVVLTVWQCSRHAARTLKPGSTLQVAHEAAVAFFQERGYAASDFPHSVGHGLGLRVHDAPSRSTPLEPGMVVTIEPGLYLPEEEIGVRIEDDYLITSSGAVLLSGAIPSHPDAVEELLEALHSQN